MNGTWFPWSGYFYGCGKELGDNLFEGPGLFKKAYRHVVDRVRAAGADNNDGTYSNLRVTSSETALEAYRKGVGDSFWVDRPTYR